MVEFFEPGNVADLARCIRELYFERDRLSKLAQGSRKFNQRYNWAKISEEYVGLLEQLRKGKDPKASNPALQSRTEGRLLK